MFWLRDKKKYYLITCSSTPVLQYDPVRMLYPAVAVASVLAVLLCRDLKTTESNCKMHLSPPVAWTAVRSKAVVLLLLLVYC